MVLKKKNQGIPFTDLRARLEEYAGMKEQQRDWYEPKEINGKRNLLTYYPFSALWQMHYYLFPKLALILLVILVVYALTFIKLPFTAAILQNINHLTTWETDFGNAGREVMPTLQRLWTGSVEDGLEAPVIAPVADLQTGDTEVPRLMFDVPLEGELVRNFGLFEDAYGDLKMSYGLLFSTPGESSVHAAAAGSVKEINRVPGGGFHLVLEHQGKIETCYNYLKEILVEERETVEQGQAIGYTGVEQAEGEFVLYFEIRDDGRPVDPLPLLYSY